MLLLSAVGGGFVVVVVVVDDCVPNELRYKKIEDPINPSILYERSHNYQWSTRACLVDQKEDLKKVVNKQISSLFLIEYQ